MHVLYKMMDAMSENMDALSEKEVVLDKKIGLLATFLDLVSRGRWASPERVTVNLGSLVVTLDATTTRFTFSKLASKPEYTVDGIWPQHRSVIDCTLGVCALWRCFPLLCWL